MLAFIMVFTVSTSSYVFAGELHTVTDEMYSDIDKQKMTREIISLFKEKGIDVYVDDNYNVVLSNNSSQNIETANDILASEIKSRTSYPTSWVYMPNSDIRRSTRANAATRDALITTLFTWLGTFTMQARILASTFASAYSVSYINQTNNVYAYIQHHYRELGQGRFDSTGNFIGNYEVRITERVTPNSNYIGGTVNYSYVKTTTLLPWMW